MRACERQDAGSTRSAPPPLGARADRRARRLAAGVALLSAGGLTIASGLPATALRQARPRRVAAYRVVVGWLDRPESLERAVCLRAFTLDGKPQRLVVDPTTLVTRVVAAEPGDLRPASWSDLRAALSETPYGRALAEAELSGKQCQDAGLKHFRTADGVSLTVDLCPSKHPLDYGLFSELIDELGAVERPVPVAIAITGAWMKTHPRDLDWLLALEDQGRLAVTWINHSYSHRVDPGARPARNFLLQPTTDVKREVLRTEAALLARGITPSVFFRFPGLVSSPKLVGKILEFGLIPTGSDAWLAKGQRPSPGSIVLVHGTGNEPLGVRRFIALLRRERAAVRERRWLLLDLRAITAASGDTPPPPEAPSTSVGSR